MSLWLAILASLVMATAGTAAVAQQIALDHQDMEDTAQSSGCQWKDLRLLFAFALGVAMTHLVDSVLPRPQDDGNRKQLELYHLLS
eukprot:CAMPEP_0197652334 /NCGR_PEP_ID=MMETSP1338-20131121/34389_1 /TAXON_ID=43686 ORGANISM="Pelagodinium beii, Strain RCC1491" /NCGR_SAMPLE_ID=MMETSP1338 /ASSEMBLY_ACC=CAM_ASM_000754 /LENGTH=85 /DNA_ID=CAMNT_0043227191 /DNA_START=83 /DNA_END=340 /DNA_ORIENTATION=-